MHNSRECRTTRQDIDESAAVGLTTGTLRHLADCEPCRTFQHERASLQRLIGSLEPVTAPADFDIRLRARLAAQRTSPATWFGFPRFAFGAPGLAIAAALVLVVGLVVLFGRSIITNRQPEEVVKTDVKQRPELGTTNTPESDVQSNRVPAPASVYTPVASAGPRVQARKGAPAVAPQDDNSRDFASTGANSIRLGENQDPTVEIPLGKPLQFSVQDKKGVTRHITLPPLSFGSPRLQGDRFQSVSYSSNRVW